MNPRNLGATLVAIFLMSWSGVAAAAGREAAPPYTPVVTPNGATLPWRLVDGVKEFVLVAEEFEHEIAPGMTIRAWGYNGRTPGPTIEAVEGDRVRIIVANRLPEPTAVHWHGVLLPNGMDGVMGLTQPAILPGDTFAYEFTLRQHGTLMYHPHSDENTQIAMGLMGFFIIHPRRPERRVDRDYALFLNEWFVEPGSAIPNPNVMTDFNIFTFNSRAFPGTAPLRARTGERVRIRIGNVGQESHPIHLHGHFFEVTGTDGGELPPSARWRETTVLVAPGQTRTIEFVAAAGDWALHCHRRHHPMNPMGHDVPVLLGVSQEGIADTIQQLLPDYMPMGEGGMHEHAEHIAAGHMPGPENTLPMMAGVGPFGPVGMGGMFTVLKVRDAGASFDEGYRHPAGSVAGPWPGEETGATPPAATAPARRPASAAPAAVYSCPMHPEIRQPGPGNCSICGMTLQRQ